MNLPDDPLLAALRVAFGPDTADAPRGRVSVRYDVREEIAHGGMGIVWRGFDLELAREVAIKTLQPGLDAHDAIVLRFANEARITGRLQHPGIVPVYEHGRLPDGRPFLTMKLIGGETLRALLDAPAGASDLRRRLSIFEQVVQTIGYAHSEGIVHRDLKPENVMVGAFGEVQVVDWGLALDLRGDGAGARGVVGTPGYMAPEQERGEPVDAHADVWALGTVLREIVGGRPDPELVALIEACCAEDKARRPQDARELAGRLDAYLGAFDARARKAEERRRTRPLRFSLAGAVLLVAALGTLGGVRLVNDRHERTDKELKLTLDELRAGWRDSADPADVARDDVELARLFRERAIDVETTAADAAIRALRGDRLVAELTDALDFWALGRQLQGQKENRWRHFVRIANAIDPDAHGRSVRAAVYARDLPRLREFAAATKPRDLSPGMWTLVANAIREFGDAEAGFSTLERAWDEYRNDFWLCYHLGQANQNKKPPREDEALRLFTALVALRPDSRVAHSELGSALFALGRLDDAEAEYRRAIALRPLLAKEHVNLSFVLREKGDLPGAVDACKRAVELDPKLTDAWIDLSTMLRLQEDRPGAIEALRRVLALRPEEAHAHFNLGVLMYEAGKLDEAIAELRETLRLAPKHPRADSVLGMCLLTQGLPRPALEHLKRGRELATSEADWIPAYDEAITECERLLALENLPEADRSPKALVDLGRLELARKEARKALVLFESAFARDPTLANDIKAGARYAAARAAALCGERGKALDWLQQDLLRWSQLLAGGTANAKRAARDALERWQKDPDLESLRPGEVWQRVAALLERGSQ